MSWGAKDMLMTFFCSYSNVFVPLYITYGAKSFKRQNKTKSDINFLIKGHRKMIALRHQCSLGAAPMVTFQNLSKPKHGYLTKSFKKNVITPFSLTRRCNCSLTVSRSPICRAHDTSSLAADLFAFSLGHTSIVSVFALFARTKRSTWRRRLRLERKC